MSHARQVSGQVACQVAVSEQFWRLGTEPPVPGFEVAPESQTLWRDCLAVPHLWGSHWIPDQKPSFPVRQISEISSSSSTFKPCVSFHCKLSVRKSACLTVKHCLWLDTRQHVKSACTKVHDRVAVSPTMPCSCKVYSWIMLNLSAEAPWCRASFRRFLDASCCPQPFAALPGLEIHCSRAIGRRFKGSGGHGKKLLSLKLSKLVENTKWMQTARCNMTKEATHSTARS